MAAGETWAVARLRELRRQVATHEARERRLQGHLRKLRVRQGDAERQRESLEAGVEAMRSAVRDARRAAGDAEAEQAAAERELRAAAAEKSKQVASFTAKQLECGTTFAKASKLQEEAAALRKERAIAKLRNADHAAQLDGIATIVDAIDAKVAAERQSRKDLQAKCRERLAREQSHEELVMSQQEVEAKLTNELEDKLTAAQQAELEASQQAAHHRAGLASAQDLLAVLSVEIESLQSQVRQHQEVNRELAEDVARLRARERDLEHQRFVRGAYGQVKPAAYERRPDQEAAEL